MNQIIKDFSKKLIREDLQKFEIGNTVQVNYRIVEGEKSRVQPFVGVVTAIHRGFNNLNATFSVRRENRGFVVERKFPTHSPNIDSIKILKKGIVRRAKLYYLNKLSGKSARLADKID